MLNHRYAAEATAEFDPYPRGIGLPAGLRRRRHRQTVARRWFWGAAAGALLIGTPLGSSLLHAAGAEGLAFRADSLRAAVFYSVRTLREQPSPTRVGSYSGYVIGVEGDQVWLVVYTPDYPHGVRTHLLLANVGGIRPEAGSEVALRRATEASIEVFRNGELPSAVVRYADGVLLNSALLAGGLAEPSSEPAGKLVDRLFATYHWARLLRGPE